MKIANALKLKNELAGNAANLKELLTQQNSRNKKQEIDYDNHTILEQLSAKLDELVRVRAATAAANTEIYAKTFAWPN
jgi:D-ribose pyranose/furanose isomerase RbsD